MKLSFLLNPVKKVIFLQFMFVIAFTGESFSQTQAPRHPVLPQGNVNIDSLKKSTEPLMQMSIAEVIAEVPTATGLFYIGCPNCNGGAQEAGVLGWKPGMGNTVVCRFCHMVFPNEKFPNNREKVIIAPDGTKQVYRYYENPEGRQYYFEAHAWFEQSRWMQSKAEQLAKLWLATQDNSYGDRAAAILGRFAQVYPDYTVKYEFPNEKKKFFPADQKWPYQGIPAYRGTKWDNWGFSDIPSRMANVYDILKSGYDWKRMDAFIGVETDKHIVNDFLKLSYEFTTANPETYHNMSPSLYRDMIQLGKVIEDPSMVHEAAKRFREFFNRGFFTDGWWKEGSPSYHNQTIQGLKRVADALKGYTDPPGWKGERFENLDLAAEIPLYQKALDVSREAVLPNGREIPINDTWARPGGRGWRQKTDYTTSRLWPAMGDAAIGTGEGDNQIVLNLNWSGNYNHGHYDNGAIILYAEGQELLSDIGYTHTKYGGWTITTASHNTVVIDEMPQDEGSVKKPGTGQLKFYDDKDIHVKVIDLDASPAYAVAKTYRRRLVMVHAGPGYDYIVDRFDVEGGKDHDWFLHGMCEQEGTLKTSIPLDQPVESLVPAWGGKEMPTSQFHKDPKRYHPYLLLRNIKTGAASEKPWTATWQYNDGIGLRTYILSPKGTQVFRFQSPSIRLAGEDDNNVDKFMRNGIMQRNSGASSAFIAIHEPFRNTPWIESVQNDGSALVIRYTINGTKVEDRVTLSEKGIVVASSAGWKYTSGIKQSGIVEALDTSNNRWRLRLDKEAPEVNYVRLDLSDGQTRYYPVASVRGKWLELKDDPGFILDKEGKVQFHTFPNDQFEGPLRYTIFVKQQENL